MDQITIIDQRIKERSFLLAYYTVLTGLEAAPQDKGLLAASRRLSAAIRSRSLELDSSKATEMSREAQETSVLLYLAIRLNGEGIYG